MSMNFAEPVGRREKSKGQSTGQSTGSHDITHDLVSILYHALQRAETYGKYMEDAGRSGEDDFRSFFLECRKKRCAGPKEPRGF